VVLLCTLEGEGHGLGIQMASIVATLAGTRTSLLGTSTPNDEIRAAAVESRARAVLVSVSLATGGIDTDRQVAALREALPEDVLLVLGGRGARGVRRGPRGVTYVEDLGELEAVLRDLQ
jgi:methylmalonyl-CoA mutase cobalamin-binding subunit